MKGLMKVLSNGLAMLKEWRMIRLCVWFESVDNCLKKRGLNVGQASRMVYNRTAWREFVR